MYICGLSGKMGGWKVEVHNLLKLGVYVNSCIYSGQNSKTTSSKEYDYTKTRTVYKYTEK